MSIRTLIGILLCCCGPGLFSQSWMLRHDYPLEAAGQVRYARCPDEILRWYPAEEATNVDFVRSHPEGFRSLPETMEIREGEIYWLKGAFGPSDGRFLIEADPFQAWFNNWSEVDIYLFAGDSLLQHIRSGNSVPPAKKQIRDARNLFWVDTYPDRPITFFIRLKSQTHLRRPGPVLRAYDHQSLQDFSGFYFRDFGEKTDSYEWVWPLRQVRSVWNSLEYVIDRHEIHTFAGLRDSWDQHARFFQPDLVNEAVNSVVWCRLKMVNLRDTTQLYWLDAAADSPKIEAFLPDGQGGYRRVQTGKNVPMEDKQIPHELSLLSFELPARDSGFLYLKYYPFPRVQKHLTTAYLVPLFFLNRNEVLTQTRNLGLWKGFMLGIMIFQLIYFSLRTILERDQLGAFYLLVIFGFLLFFIGTENNRNTFLAWQLFFEFNAVILNLAFLLVATGLYLFSNRYLQLREQLPLAYNVQRVNLILLIVLVTGNFIQQSTGDYFDTSAFYQLPVLALLFLVFSLFFLVYTAYALIGSFKHWPNARNYLIAFSPFLTVGMVNSYQSAIAGNFAVWRVNLIYIAFIITTILFAVLVAKRNNAIRRKEILADSLISLNRAKQQFYDNITHEFRTPITVIRGVANFIRGHEEEKMLIRKNSQEVLDLVDQLIGFSQAQSDTSPIRLIEDDVLTYLEYLVESVQPLAAEKEIDLQFQCAQEEIILAFDREKLKLILNNLLSNALKFTPPGGSVLVTAGIREPYFCIEVQDEGIGLEPEETTRIFDRYYQVKATVDGQSPAAGGIGLALVRELVARLGGKMQVESRKNEGSTFQVMLPLQRQDPDPETGQEGMSESYFQTMENEHIALVVEDNPDVRYYLERLLTPHYKIVSAADGQEGFEKAAALVPDIIISDVIMPRMDGYRLTARLKEDLRTSHIPIILLTAKGRHEERMMGLAGGADAYLVKPFAEDELMIRIKTLIENRAQLRKVYTGDKIRHGAPGATDPFLRKAQQVLEEHFADDAFGVNDLAAALHLSRMQVHRKLKALTQHSSCQFINSYRLERAKQLILQDEMNVSEVAYACGFSDPGYFSKLFSKAYGTSPLHFKRSQGT